MKIEFSLQGDMRAMFGSIGAGLRDAIDAGTLKAANGTRDFARVVMRQGLGSRAANTIGLRQFQDTGAAGVFSRWLQDGENVPFAFSIGATIRPTNRQFLAIPSDEVRAGILPSSVYQPGQLPARGRRQGVNAGVRLSPKTFEYKTGVKLHFVPPGNGRRYGMLVVENARVTQKGQVRGSRRKTSRYSYIAFFLVPQTKLPQRLEWQPVIGRSQELLEQDVREAIQAAGIV